jgi:hypothetical protein
MPPVRLLQAPEELVAAPEHVGRGGDRLEVGRVQGRGPLRARQRVVRVATRPGRCGLTAPVERRPSCHDPMIAD